MYTCNLHEIRLNKITHFNLINNDTVSSKFNPDPHSNICSASTYIVYILFEHGGNAS